MTHEDYVTYEQAIKLKELEFDWKCNHYYHLYDELPILSYSPKFENFNKFDKTRSAPTLAQAQKWLREKEIEVCACADFEGSQPNGKWMVFYRKLSSPVYATDFSTESKDTYEQALSAGIDKALAFLKEAK